MRTEELIEQIERLAHEEHALFDKESRGEASTRERARLKEIEGELEACYDLLRARRARRAAGLDPGRGAGPRPLDGRGTDRLVPHGTHRVGRVDVIALCDAVVVAGGSSEDKFPGGSSETWDEARERYAEVFGERDAWRLHVHCFVLRSGGRTVLVDTGIGPESAPAFAWTATRGRLPEELEAAGVSPGEVDQVLITHVHDDHLGWNVTEDATSPLFPNARYVVHEADWSLMADTTDEEDRTIFASALQPLERSGVLVRSKDRSAITDELTLVHAPGHTPGHQVVLIDSDAGGRCSPGIS